MFRLTIIRILLSPLAFLYGLVILLINFFYDTGILKASKFSIPVISVGNLSIGGAGKTPHIEYLIELLKDYIYVATLSRGYQRKTSGFRFVHANNTAYDVGDEPLQYRRKYPEIMVAVSESRAYAIPQIIQKYPQTQTILLDDAFQHRAVKPSLNILLTAYDSLFTDDYLLPAGRLREWRSSYKRADVIIVSKGPSEMTEVQKNNIIKKIAPFPHQKIYFSYYQYGYPYSFFNPIQRISLDPSLHIVLLSAIANTDYLLQYLNEKVASVIEIEFADHHFFDTRDIEKIAKVYKSVDSENKIILTTEKDAMRLEIHKELLSANKLSIYILPAKVSFNFNEGAKFDDMIKNFLLSFEV